MQCFQWNQNIFLCGLICKSKQQSLMALVTTLVFLETERLAFYDKAQAKRDIMNLETDSLLFAYFKNICPKGSLISSTCISFWPQEHSVENTSSILHFVINL